MALIDAQVATRLPAQDLDRARRWYSDKLGLDPVEERGGALRYVVGGGEFSIFLSSGASTGAFTQLAFTVTDIATEVAEMTKRGVVFEEYNEPGLTTTESVARIAGNYPSKGTSEFGSWFRDSEGNLLGMGQSIS